MNTKPDATPPNDDHPHQTSTDEANPESISTPAGVVGDLRDLADESGGTTDPDDVPPGPDGAPQPTPLEKSADRDE